VIRAVDPLAPLSVGNGRFAFTVDVTGLQTFPDAYREIPLATQAEWGWHSFANPAGYTLADATATYDSHGRQVPYASAQSSEAGAWLRANPHRLSLGRVGLALRKRDGGDAAPADLSEIEQRLDLWTGTIDSRFRVDGRPVRVLTCAHPERDLIAVRVEGEGIGDGWLAARVAFPYASAVHTGDPADWTKPERHRTAAERRDGSAVAWRRTFDGEGGAHTVRAAWSGGVVREDGAHAYTIAPSAGASAFELVLAFEPEESAGALPEFAIVRRAAAAHWARFWTEGGVLDLGASADPRAKEVERRVVLSEYLTAVNCAGRLPPQETGETFDSWFGKFHLEMHPWHAAHFALWGREALLERSLPWYRTILPVAREAARRQGYAGARWPKMVGPDGRESPSGIGPFLVWQQPHPIRLAELVYRARPAVARRRVLDAYRDVVFASAEFMASYPHWDGSRFVLGPPLIPAQESHPPRTTFNPTFELAYWAEGLETAQRWRRRLGMPRHPAWDRVLRALSPLPMRDGLYVNAESAPTTFTDADQRRDHPTVLGAYGFVGSPRVDREAMRRTLRRVMETWQWPETWGWDYPLVAMTAARLGEPEVAVEALLMDTPKNRYLPNGHNYQRPGLSIYLPGNGGVLLAAAMMAAGWDGAPNAHAPGFPRRGWTVAWEGLRPAV
jgi:protein-glucosylgalactosylhydroxylysine glucosidase